MPRRSGPIEWAGLGPELLVALDRTIEEPLRLQLERQLRDAIRSGRLAPGERLPSSRVLARDLGISRGLAFEAYAQLQAEGFLTSRGGSATRVASVGPTSGGLMDSPSPPPRLEVDFCSGVPDLTSFPRGDWAWAMRESCRAASVAELGYGDPRGIESARAVLAGYLRRVRGAAVDERQMFVCVGFGQGINLMVRVFARAGGRSVAIEDPGDVDHVAIAERAGLVAIPIPVDDRGIDVDALATCGARLVVLTPTHQHPTGVALAPERRQALARWAQENDAIIVEDDYDAEFRYDRSPVGALQSLAPDRVALVGTVSKSLAPALRLGWVVCPAPLIEAMCEEKRLDDRGSPALEQFALAAMIESGRYDRHLRRMRGVYAARRAALIRALSEHAPNVELTGLAAGFHAVARLPSDVEETEVVDGARARSIGLHGMSSYRLSRRTTWPPALVVGFGNLAEQAIERGIASVGDLLSG